VWNRAAFAEPPWAFAERQVAEAEFSYFINSNAENGRGCDILAIGIEARFGFTFFGRRHSGRP
jgi:hypothetical protein